MAELLTTRQVQDILRVDRTTIYRMVEAGQLPALRVGKQWRFQSEEVERWLRAQATSAAPTDPAPPGASTAAATTNGRLAEMLPLACSQLVQDAFADILSVMMVVTDMQGNPVTEVSNPCGLYSAVVASRGGVARCAPSWQTIAGVLPIEPKYFTTEIGLLCARGLIRSGSQLLGMVVAGGIAPEDWPPTPAEIDDYARPFELAPAEFAAHVNEAHVLDKTARERLLRSVQRIADIFSHMAEDRSLLQGRLQAIASLTSW